MKNENLKDLPAPLQKGDTVYPTDANRLGWEERKALGLEDLHSLRLYEAKGCGWVICTLHISNPRRGSANQTERTYAIGLKDEKVYTVGRGPHVLREVEVYIRKDNLERLKPLIDLHRKGMEMAGGIRDRISSRRAQGQIHRAAGRDRWSW
jgi:hypothetical protein